jgi:glutathione S-transferase
LATSAQNGPADNATIRLYWQPGTCARMPHVALEEIGVPYELIVINKFTNDHLTPEYKKINPKGRVPTLVVDGRPLTENPAILTYLHRRYPEARLLPTGSLEVECDALSTMCWFSSSVHPNVSRHRFPRFYSKCQDSECLDGVRMEAREQLELLFGILEQRLDGRQWLYDEWSIIDVYMLWLWFRAAGSGMDASPFPRCVDHARRCEERPTVARVLDREEDEWARHQASGAVIPNVPPYHVGRAPVYA